MNFTNLKHCLDRIVQEYHTPGVDCIVYRNHEMIFRYWNGMRDLERGLPIDGKELYLIFSMTKLLTCTCALQLLEQGKFQLNDPVSMYLPEFASMKVTRQEVNPEHGKDITSGSATVFATQYTDDGYAKQPMTIRHLFTMCGGLDYDLWCAPITKAISEGKTTTLELVKAMGDKVLGFEPGTRYDYSLCHDVLGALVEVWSGQTLGQYMKENLLEPLGMKDTSFGVPKDANRLSRMAALYRFSGDGQIQKEELACPYNITEAYESGGAGVVSSTEDYAVFLDALACGGMSKDGKRILSTAAVNLMKTNHLFGKPLEDFNQVRPGYGYGLGVRTHLDPAKSGSFSPLEEFGWDGAAGAFALADCANQLSLTYFQQIYGWDARIQNELRNALYSCLD